MGSQHAMVGQALDLLTQGLAPVVEHELNDVLGDEWLAIARHSVRNEKAGSVLLRTTPAEWDAQALLTVMWDQWNAVFRQRLGLLERSYVSELREFRNRWAHQTQFDDDDAYRILDTSQRLLAAIGVDDELLAEFERLKLDVLRHKLSEHVQDDRERARTNRQQWVDLSLYGLCAGAIIFTTFAVLVPRNPGLGWLFVGFVTFTFGYIGYKRITKAPIVHGVHECPKCKKIIYSEVCPYCEAPPPSSSILRGGSAVKFPPFKEPTAQPL